VQTPNLDRLAGNGALFTRAYTQNTVCIPSRACLHTGRHIHQHGVQYMESEIDTTPPLPPWEKTFMERLQDVGYRTGACGKIHMMQPKGYHETALCGGKGSRWTRIYGQQIGPAPLGPKYAAWLDKKRPGAYEEIYAQRRKPEYRENRTAIVNTLAEDEYVEYWIQEEAVSFLNRRKGQDRPFFLWIGFCGPHGPFDPPKRYADMYPVSDMPLPQTFSVEKCADPERESRLAKKITAHYYAMMTCIDEMVAGIVKALRGNGQFNDTIIFFTSDHGEMLGDKNRYGKGVFYEPVLRIPTFVYHPDIKNGFRFNGLVETFSIAPTVLELAGVDPPSEMAAESLVPVLFHGGKGKESVLSEYVDNKRDWHNVCTRTGRHKLMCSRSRVTNEQQNELYDLDKDPLEQHNVYDDPAYSEDRSRLTDVLLGSIVGNSVPAYSYWLHKLPSAVRSRDL